MYMSKGANGQWSIAKVTRGEAPTTAAPPAAPAQWRSEANLARDMAGPDALSVRLDTTKGAIHIKLVPAWAPLGVQRFLELIDDGFYSQIAIYRAIKSFLVQFGVAKHAQRSYQKIQDDPLIGIPIQTGSVCFAASGPNTRKNQICLWLGDFPDFGKSPWETPIGKVTAESMPVLLSLFTGYGDIPQCGGQGPDPHKLEELGNEYLAPFPQLDYVVGAARV
jgi:cyclophilin family peptidyl-prolyl cis-trans isomerase